MTSSGPEQHASCQPCPIGTYGMLDSSADPMMFTRAPNAHPVNMVTKKVPLSMIVKIVQRVMSLICLVLGQACIQCSVGEVCQECSAGTYFDVNTCVECEIERSRKLRLLSVSIVHRATLKLTGKM